MYKKECPNCGEYTYSADHRIWVCCECGEIIKDIEVEPSKDEPIEKYMIGQDKPDWTDV